jgi:hypothetical protein
MGAGPLGSRGYRLWSLYYLIGTPERTREGVHEERYGNAATMGIRKRRGFPQLLGKLSAKNAPSFPHSHSAGG